MHPARAGLALVLSALACAADLEPKQVLQDACKLQMSDGCRLGKPGSLEPLKGLLGTSGNQSPGFVVTFWEKRFGSMVPVCAGSLGRYADRALLVTAAHCVVFPTADTTVMTLGRDRFDEQAARSVSRTRFWIPETYQCCVASADLAFTPDPFGVSAEVLSELPLLASFDKGRHRSIELVGRNASNPGEFLYLVGKAWDATACQGFWAVTPGEKGSGSCFKTQGLGAWSTATPGDSGSPAVFPTLLKDGSMLVGVMSLSTFDDVGSVPAHVVVAPLTASILDWAGRCQATGGSSCVRWKGEHGCARDNSGYCEGEARPTPPS